ncbi:proline dehydrogenase family protein [Halobacteriales archaeon Cl-PHB]
MIPPLARRFVAGETAAAALDHARKLNDRDVGAICNLLGEHYDDPVDARADAETYCGIISELGQTDLEACISVKPSQLGLDVGEETFREHLATVVECAAEHDRFVWIDMEDHETVDATLDAFEHHAREYGEVGVCIQANMRRTREDLERLADLPGKVRLVKGAYDPPAELAYQEKSRVNRAFREDLEFMFDRFEDGVAVGSHDPEMVDLAADLHDEYGTPYEVQMLMGVRTDAQYDLATDREVWQYVPYGGKWLSYFYRRVAERRQNLLFALRALLPW